MVNPDMLSIPKHEITGKHSKNRKKTTTYWKSKEF